MDITNGADKLYALIENPSQVDTITLILPEELYLSVSRDNLAMIMHKEAKKINGVLEIANEFLISEDEILAFGDDINDKEMLLNCGVSVAMGNAIEEIKMVTDYICDINDNDGVAEWIENNILMKELY